MAFLDFVIYVWWLSKVSGLECLVLWSGFAVFWGGCFDCMLYMAV